MTFVTFNGKETGAEMCLAIVSGIVIRDAPVSYWPIFSPVPSNSPRSLCKSFLGPVPFSLVPKVVIWATSCWRQWIGCMTFFNSHLLRFIPYTVNCFLYTLEHCEPLDSERVKTPDKLSCSILMILVFDSNAAWLLILKKWPLGS